MDTDVIKQKWEEVVKLTKSISDKRGNPDSFEFTGSLVEDSRTPLDDWNFIMYLFPNGTDSADNLSCVYFKSKLINILPQKVLAKMAIYNFKEATKGAVA